MSNDEEQASATAGMRHSAERQKEARQNAAAAREEAADAKRQKEEAEAAAESAKQEARSILEKLRDVSEKMSGIATRIAGAVADAEAERHQWQELPPPAATLSDKQLSKVTWRAALAGSAGTALVLALALGAYVFFTAGGGWSLPFTGGAAATPGGSETDAATRQEQVERMERLISQFDESEKEVWNRECRPIRRGEVEDLEKWRGQCRRMLQNQAAE